MNLFEAVKDAIPTRTAAEHYGIEVKRNGMACCPFHDDRTPSMKVDKRFHCFGCQEDGDVIDFVGKLFDLSPKRAAEKLAEDFGVRYEGLQTWQPQRRPSVISKLAAAHQTYYNFLIITGKAGQVKKKYHRIQGFRRWKSSANYKRSACVFSWSVVYCIC